MNYKVTLNGKIYEVEVTECDAKVTGVSQVPVSAVAAPAPVAAAPAAPAAAAPAAAPAAPAASATDGTPVKAPMPGTIIAVKKNAGEAVKAGDVVVVLEAMKMENDIVAPADGKVASIVVGKGDSVNVNDVLVVLA